MKRAVARMGYDLTSVSAEELSRKVHAQI